MGPAFPPTPEYRPLPLPAALYSQASSPDEEALVQGAAYCGYTLLTRLPDAVEVQ